MQTEPDHRAETLADQFHSLAIHLLRRLRREDAQSGLSAPRLSALSVVVFAGPICLGDLAEAEQVRAPTMTRTVNALEAMRLVKKKVDRNDARSLLIEATAAGKRLLAEGRRRRVAALARQIAALHVHQKDVLEEAGSILTTLLANI